MLPLALFVLQSAEGELDTMNLRLRLKERTPAANG